MPIMVEYQIHGERRQTSCKNHLLAPNCVHKSGLKPNLTGPSKGFSACTSERR